MRTRFQIICAGLIVSTLIAVAPLSQAESPSKGQSQQCTRPNGQARPSYQQRSGKPAVVATASKTTTAKMAPPASKKNRFTRRSRPKTSATAPAKPKTQVAASAQSKPSPWFSFSRYKRNKHEHFNQHHHHKGYAHDTAHHTGKNKAVPAKTKQAYTHQHQHKPSPKAKPVVKANYNARQKFVPRYNPRYITRVGNFDGIVADGDMIVTVNPSRDQQIHVIRNGKPGYKKIDIAVKRGMLYLHTLNEQSKNGKKIPQTKPVSISVDTPYLTHIKLRNGAQIIANDLRSKNLVLDSDSPGSMTLRGNVNVKKIVQRGPGCINAEWIDSDELQIIASGGGTIKLAGTANMLNIRAVEHATIDAKYLRAQKAFIQTGDVAKVETTVIDSLSGFASDHSNIYYFKTPVHLARHTTHSGTVMQMRYWN